MTPGWSPLFRQESSTTDCGNVAGELNPTEDRLRSLARKINARAGMRDSSESGGLRDFHEASGCHAAESKDTMSIEAKIQELGLRLPDAPPAGGTYSPVVVIDKMAYVSGQGPYGTDGKYLTGKVGDDLTEEQGIEAARVVGLTMLATIKAQLGSLDKVKRIVKVLGMVNSTADFPNHPKVINGLSDLMVEIFGENGRAARSAVGMGSLPGNIAVEIEAILELNE